MKRKLLLLLIAIVIALVGYMILANRRTGDQPKVSSAVKIDSIAPADGPIGTTVILTGSGFDLKSNDIGFSYTSKDSAKPVLGYLNNAVSADGKTVSFNLPQAVGICMASTAPLETACPTLALLLPKERVEIFVVNKSGTSNKVGFVIN